MRLTSLMLAGLVLASAAAAGEVKLTIHNPMSGARTAERVTIPPALLRKGIKGDWVAVAAGQVSTVQFQKYGAVTVLDLPAKPEIAMLVRPRLSSDPKPRGVASAVIPAKIGGSYKHLPSIVVPPGHKIHDPLFPMEGAGWESDRVGYRVYLDERNAADIFGKKLPAPVLGKIGQGGPDYHLEAAWGMDVWKVGQSLGAGGLGVLRGKMAEQIGPMKKMTATVVADGPVVAELQVDCDGWLYNGKPQLLTENFSISAGSRLSMNAASASPGVPLVAGFGKYPNTTYLQARKGAWGYIATWGRQSEDGKDNVGVALFYKLDDVERTGDDGRSTYVLFKNPVRAPYVFVAGWARETGGLPTRAAFENYVERTALNLANPVSVTK